MIRPLLPDDVDAVLDVWLRASISAHAFMPPEHWQQRVPFVRDVCLPQCLTFVFVDDESGEIAGFASLLGECLAGLFVAPAQQGRGIGSRLFGLARRICPALHLTVYAENTRARAFYARQGLRVRESRRDADTGHEELVMGLPAAAT